MKGVLLIHTGVPKSTTEAAIKQFQQEIAEDPLLIDKNQGTPEWSDYEIPESISSQYQRIRLNLLKEIEKETNIPIAIASRYGDPTIRESLEKLANSGVTKLLVYPLYPQFASATIWSAITKSMEIQEKYFPEMEMDRFVTFYDREEYIDIMTAKITEILKKDKPDHIVFSYHGVPEFFSIHRDVTKNECSIENDCCDTESDENIFCYKTQCFITTSVIANELQLDPESYSTSFHSRLGLEPWLFPVTKKVMQRLAERSVKKTAIVFPGIVISDLEYEHALKTAKSAFLNAGGKKLIEIPNLNDDKDWAKTLALWIDQWRIIDVETGIA